MENFLFLVKKFLIDLFFPVSCLNCGREGEYLCQDCRAILPILENYFCLCQKPIRLPKPGKCKKCQKKKLNGLYFALSYQNQSVKKIIRMFKYQPFAKDLAKTLASLIIIHFQLIEKGGNFSDFILIPVPLGKRRLKERGFNQAEEIGKELSDFLKISPLGNCLFKIKETSPQIELSEKEREENVLGVFSCQNKNKIQGKKIFLIDDVYTTGSTMEECARVLKTAGAKEVWGIVVARAEPGEDNFENV